jgi:hypothetical protein
MSASRPAAPSTRTLAPVLLLATGVLLGASASALAQSAVYVSTWGGGMGRVLRYVAGETWEDISPPGGVGREVWDIEWINGELWAAGRSNVVGTGPQGVLLAWDGTTWRDEAPAGGFAGTVTSVTLVGSLIHVTTLDGDLFRRTAPRTWPLVGSGSGTFARAWSSESHDGRPLLYIGDNGLDNLWVHDPDGLLACTATCPGASGALCPAGCYGGSCIYTFTDFDPGTGPAVYAGAYSGAVYRWSSVTRSFARTFDTGGGHVQGLASWRGRLWIGESVGLLRSTGRGSLSDMRVEETFGSSDPVSYLAVDPVTDELWAGFGGVPFGFARRDGTSRVRSFDGTTWLDRSPPGAFGTGVLTILIVPPDATSGPSCDAGPDQVVECAGAATPVTLDGSGSRGAGGSVGGLDLAWSGPFIEGTASGERPIVHFDGVGSHDVSLTVTQGLLSDGCTVRVDVVDTLAPDLAGVPAPARVACDAVPGAPAVSALDACDGLVDVTFAETRLDGPCPDTYTLVRAWTARDGGGNETSQERRIDVVDEEAPVLIGVPDDVTVECDAVPPPASPRAMDACDPAPAIAFVETRADGRCPGEWVLQRTWVATDRCGNRAAAAQVVTVVDTRPPVVTESSGDAHCLWPPNHGFVAFSRADFAPTLTDNCSEPVSWIFAGCASTQPEDDLGDGRTGPDCVVSPDGAELLVRAERQGGDPAGRRYAVRIVATDACGNSSAPALIGHVHVPHDQSPAARGCRKPTMR